MTYSSTTDKPAFDNHFGKTCSFDIFTPDRPQKAHWAAEEFIAE
jgi:hypothetical protein